MPSPKLSSRFEEALCYAAHLHARQTRKASEIPYIAHLLSVCALVLEAGGDEDEAIAALLHDAVEDQGGTETLEAIRKRYGDRVAAIVSGCSDAFETPKPPWRERKERYLKHLQYASASVRRVSLADKVHNARSILRDLQLNGETTWAKFKGGKEGTLWYYQSLLEIFQQQESNSLVHELARVVAEIKHLSGEAA